MNARPILATTRSVVSKAALQNRIVALDGVRGVAILMVMALHFLCSMSRGGDALDRILGKLASYGVYGVDLFFVLSGFLITGILADTKGRPNYFKSFVLRRTLRIFPLYYGVVALVVVAPHIGVTDAVAPHLAEVGAVQGWLWSYLTNFYLATTNSFSIPYVSHFWSLAIEEQFYLGWPLLIALLSRRAAMNTCLVLCLLALGARLGIVWGTTNPPLAHVVLTPCRLDTLCAGAWFALLLRSDRGISQAARASRLAFFGGGVLVVGLSAAHLLLRGSPIAQSFRGLALSVFFAGFICYIAISDSGNPLRRSMELGWLGWLGKYSYGLYVFHGIVAFLMEELDTLREVVAIVGAPGLGLVAHALLGTALSVGIAVVSYEVYEKPFLRLKSLFRAG